MVLVMVRQRRRPLLAMAAHGLRQLTAIARPEVAVETATTTTATVSNDDVDILRQPDHFNVASLFTLEDLFRARVHLGHRLGSLNPRMAPYLYGTRLSHCIFDLDQTADHLRRALNFTAHIAFRDGIILFLMRHPQHAHLVEKTAAACGEFAHTKFWRGGVFTNAEKQFGAVTRLPDLCIFLGTLNTVLAQHRAVRDAAKMLIPTVAIVDSNCDPGLVTYPVPGNDDSPPALELYCRLFSEAVLRGKQAAKQRRKDV